MKKVTLYISRLLNTIKYLRLIWRDGGFKPVVITKASYGEMLKGKRVVITGGASGIGLAMAQRCLDEGAFVLITGRSLDKLNSVKQEINNPNLSYLLWDIADVDVIENNLFKASELLGGSIDVLVNNAGILTGFSFPDTDVLTWDITYATNSKGLFFLTQTLCKFWIKSNKTGKIINISSTGGFLAANNVYRMTKWDLVGFTKAIGLAMAKYGIIVNGIAPGRTATKMLNADPDENLYDTKQPLNRYAHPIEIAELALFLMSDSANYIVGQTIVCDGGYTIKI